MAMTQWYYGSQGQQSGPLSETQLRRMIANGSLPSGSLVWREGMNDWKPVSAVMELHGPPQPSLENVSPQIYPHGVMPQSGLAVASMVCGIVGMITCYVHGVAAIPAVICGHLAIKAIRESPVPMAGRGMAIAGLVMGYLGILLQLATLSVIFYFFYIVKSTSFSP
jgi:hypothetical protein